MGIKSLLELIMGMKSE